MSPTSSDIVSAAECNLANTHNLTESWTKMVHCGLITCFANNKIQGMALKSRDKVYLYEYKTKNLNFQY